MTSANPSNAGASLSEKKKDLRKSITARLRALDDSYVAAEASRLFPRLLALEEYTDSTCVSLYLSMPAKEVPTFPDLLEAVMTDGKGAEGRARDVYVPKVTGPAPGDMVMLPLSSPEDVSSFPVSKWGIPEPPLPPSLSPSLPPLDLVLVPGVAFDNKCNRLGHGKGYYDSFLSRLFASHAAAGRARPMTIGLALEEQMVASVPVDTFDLPLDAVVTPDKVYFRKDRERKGG
ncbi:hypothetical protein NSK_005304 [Nannochloropsis salina CCMP1776]|uniref:5-formyltetrahydrofolate cyclo-ligase n=1 Tax=Nannochloropsis salina CCMP1776 TaxID=1027361 RepID=A0A4D9D4C9_9STRA|nr:hypothetical protein NSK_005304 [Nannochloropsis salina CCMP1776]|eukprot:TFJ83399.1 hypothetical protein NSK_005304 [Nannochloropsis salina CCMP1776]